MNYRWLRSYECLIIIIFLIIAPFNVLGQDWPEYGHDDKNTGLSSSSVPSRLDVIWSKSIDGEPLSIISEKGTVYVGLRDYITGIGPFPDLETTYGGISGVIAFNMDDGSKRWVQEVEDDVRGLAISGDKLIVSSFEHLVAMNKMNGEIIWDTNIGTDMFPSAIHENKAFVTSFNSNVYAVNIENGKVIWSFDAYGSFLSSLVVYNEKVIFGSKGNRVYAVNENNGSVVWEFQTSDEIISTPSIHEGVVYIGSNDGNLYGLDAVTGELISNFETEGRVYSPAIGYENVYFMCKINGEDYKVIAVNINTFSKEWEFHMKEDIRDQPTLADGKVIIGAKKNLYILDAKNGEEILQKELDIEISTQPIISDDKIIVGTGWSGQYKIYVLGEKSPEENQTFPIVLIFLIALIAIFVFIIRKIRSNKASD